MPDLASAGLLAGYGIAITRPIDQAGKLSALITAEGGQPVMFPLIAIAPLEDYSAFEQTLDALCDYDWAIFISSNAVNHAMPRLLERLGHIPQGLKFAAIGPTTAAELAKFGVANTLTPVDRFDSESLLSLPDMQAVADKKVMIFRGVGGREILANTLLERGAQVDFAECYQRVNPQTDAGILSTLWQNKALHAVVVTSSEAMRHLLALTEQGLAPWIKQVTLCVNHARIAEELLKATSPGHQLNIAIADAPGDEAMMRCLTKALHTA